MVLSLRLTEQEVEKVVLDPKEYETSQWVEPALILEGEYHPALKFAVQSLLGSTKLHELTAAVQMHPSNDVEVARLARELVALTTSDHACEGTSAYRVVAPNVRAPAKPTCQPRCGSPSYVCMLPCPRSSSTSAM